MSIAAPSVVWTPLPPDFVNVSLAAVDRTVLLGGGGQYVSSGPPVPPAVLELEIAGGAAVVRQFWKLPAQVPSNPRIESPSFEEFGPAMVDARRIGATAVSTVMFRSSPDFAGSRGGWYHPLGTDTFEYIGSASTESDIGANEPVAIGDGVLATSEWDFTELFVVERQDILEDVTWPGGASTRSFWRHRQVPLPDGIVTSGVQVSPSGRWLAVRGDDTARMRDGVLVYAREPSGWALSVRLDYPGYRVAGLAVTDDWLVVLESANGDHRLRWRAAVTGEDRYLEVGAVDTALDVLGDRALLTQGTRALVVDLARGVVTHNIQRGGEAELGSGTLVPDFAVFAIPAEVGRAIPGKVGVAQL